MPGVRCLENRPSRSWSVGLSRLWVSNPFSPPLSPSLGASGPLVLRGARKRSDLVTFFSQPITVRNCTFGPSDISPESLRLTSRPKLHNRMGGTPLPTEGHLSGRVDEDDRARAARNAAAKSFLLLRSLRQTPRLVSRQSQECDARLFAPLGCGQGQAQACHQPNPRAAQAT